MGPVLDRLAGHLRLMPQEKPGLLEQLQEARSRQIEAVEFAFQHDDGQNTDDLGRAEVVLVGVSRSMKTPTMLYLAYRGWFAANVPLIPEVRLPTSLLKVPPRRVFCLFTNPSRLLELRRVRARQQNIPEDIYASMDQIRKELQYAEQLCLKQGWQRLEATSKSVEELCQEITTLLVG
jgi:regulator of PEP synthase PpsR (kinase-PPPase family)